MVWHVQRNDVGLCWEKDAEDGASNQEKRAKEVYGCSVRGHAGCWCARGEYRGQGWMKTYNLLWRPLKRNN